MTDPSSDDPRRASRERLKGSFLTQALSQVHEIGQMLSTPDPSVPDAAAYEIERLALTSESLGLDDIASTAREAVLQIRGGASNRSLLGLAAAIRAAGPRARFPPLVIVAREPLLAKLQTEALRCCEPIVLCPSLDAMRAAFLVEEPEALVVPYEDLSRLSAEEELSAPLYVYGPPDDLAARVSASANGVTGFLPDRIEFRSLLDRVRNGAWQQRAPARRAVLLLEDEDLRNALAERLGFAEGDVRLGRRAEDLFPLLKESSPDLLVLGGTLGTAPVSDLIPAVRAHPRFSDVALVVLAEAAEVVTLLEREVDLVLPPQLPVDEMARRVLAISGRSRRRCGGRDPGTGIYSRSGALFAVDRAVSEARRGGRTFSLALVEIDGLAEANLRHGRSTGDAALRVLIRCIEGAIRAHDLVGRIASESLLVLFPSCNADKARQRLLEIQGMFASLVVRDERLAGLTFSAGATDTEDGTENLLARTEASLERARAREARGVIG